LLKFQERVDRYLRLLDIDAATTIEPIFVEDMIRGPTEQKETKMVNGAKVDDLNVTLTPSRR
jgi:hypothetical protein